MLNIEHLTKKYGDIAILEDAEYVFPEQGLVCLLGASGSGKTTLLNLIAGFDSDYQGEISSCGYKLSKLNRDALCTYRRDCVGFVFQNYHLLSGYSVLENILTAAEFSPDSQDEKKRRAELLLVRLGLSEKAEQSVESLSGGQKQRVAIARALMGNPEMILADEPTGALDRKTSNEIMGLLKELSAERLVLVITHDAKVCEFADEVIHIQNRKIVAERTAVKEGAQECSSNSDESAVKEHRTCKTRNGVDGVLFPRKRAAHNFKIHLKRYLAVAAAISLGMLAFLFSLSFGNVMDMEIQAFQEKNTVFNNGYIKGTDDGTILQLLEEEPRIENVYHQYRLSNAELIMEGHTEIVAEKLPLPKTTESLSYGVMPRRAEDEIALTPSLAKKFAPDIKTLLGESMTLNIGEESYSLTICGIYNAGYDDFFISSDIEQQIYAGLPKQDNYSISYDVKGFEDVVAVSNFLELRGIHPQNAAAEVYAMQKSFGEIQKLFLIISILVLLTAWFLCTVLLVKMQNSRFREMGLLSALGFRAGYIRSMVQWENLFLSFFSAAVTACFMGASAVMCSFLGFPLKADGMQVLIFMAGVFLVIIGISTLASVKLIRTEPAEALRHE